MDPDYAICNNSYLPSSKQYFTALGSSFTSSVLIIGGLITLGLFILFFELVVFTNSTAHRGARRHIIWIASVFPVMTSMSLVSLLVPRADNICISVKMVYMSIGISHFTDLTMVMFGGEEMFIERARGEAFNLRLAPLCCCCRCLPNTPVTRYSHRLVAILTDQLPFIQAAYYVIISVLLAADNVQLGDVQPSGAFLWLNIIKITSVLLGVYGFKILSYFSRDHLDDFDYWRKSRSINILLLITNFQTMIFNIMLNYGVFPCQPPYLSPSVYKQTVDNAIYLLEMMILGPYTFYQYHDQKFSSPIDPYAFYRSRNDSVSVASAKDSIPATVSTTVSITAGHSSDSEDEHSSSGEDSRRGDERDVTSGNWNSRNSSMRGNNSRVREGNAWNEEQVGIDRENVAWNGGNGGNGAGIRNGSNMSGARYKESARYKDNKYKGRLNTGSHNIRDSSISSKSSGGKYKENIRYKGDDNGRLNGDRQVMEVQYGEGSSSSGSSSGKYKEDSGWEKNVYNVGMNIGDSDSTNTGNTDTYKTTNTNDLTSTNSTYRTTNKPATTTTNIYKTTNTNDLNTTNSTNKATTNITNTNASTNTDHHTSLLDKARSLASHTGRAKNEYERF